MNSLVVSALILATVAISAYLNYRRGLMAVFANVLGFAMGLLVAGLFYRAAGRVVISWFHVMPSIAHLVAYAGLFVLAQMLLLLTFRLILLYWVKQVNVSPASRAIGATIGVIQTICLLAVSLTVIMGSPLPTQQKELISGATLARPLVPLGHRLQNIVNTVPKGDLNDTVTLLSVDPESESTISLDFTTVDVRAVPTLEHQMLQLINNERTSRGLGALTFNNGAAKVGENHSRDMFARGYFSHVTPEGASPFDRMKKGGVKFGAAGENIALAPDLLKAHNALMKSPGHRANILSPAYRAVGIGIIDGGTYGIMVTQDFTDQ